MKKLFFLAPMLALVGGALGTDDTFTIRFTGRVIDAGGQPLVGAGVMINRVSGAALAGDISALKTVAGTNGTFELPLALRPTSEARVRCELWFDHPGFVRSERALTVAANKNAAESLAVTLKPGLILSGIIRAPSSRNGRTDAPQLIKVAGEGYEGYFLTDKAGAFAVYVPPGEYEISTPTENPPFVRAGIKAGTTNLVIEPEPFVWSEAVVGKVFDDFWREMDLRYSYFFLKTNVDWAASGKEFRLQAIRAKNADELAKVLKEMLAPLRDMHVWIETPSGSVGTYSSSYTFNGNGKVTRAAIAETAQCGKFAVVGKTKSDGFGYFLMLRQSNATEDLVKQAIAAIDALRDVPGFIVDLRAANGGSEPFAQQIAERFCAQETVYAKSKYRNGPGHGDFTRAYARTLRAAPNPYTKPVVCLIGPGAVSSGEGFVKMMKALPHVTTVGLSTRGASGNPKPYRLGGSGVTVTFSRWVDMLPNGETFEGRGIPPDLRVDKPVSAYAEADPTLEGALEVLRSKIGGPRTGTK